MQAGFMKLPDFFSCKAWPQTLFLVGSIKNNESGDNKWNSIDTIATEEHFLILYQLTKFSKEPPPLEASLTEFSF